MQRSWRDAAYWLIPYGWLSLISYKIQDCHSRDDTNGLGPSPLINNEDNALQLDLTEAFLQMKFHLHMHELVGS